MTISNETPSDLSSSYTSSHEIIIETPQHISALVLNVLPALLETIFSNPINQVVIVGFITGLIMTIAVVYVKRPRYQ